MEDVLMPHRVLYLALIISVLLSPAQGLAHGELSNTGQSSGLALALPISLLVLYGIGLYRLWGNAGRGAGVSGWRALCFVVGMSLVIAALLPSTGKAVGDSLAAHMVQHVVFLVVAPPLLVAGAPLVVILWGSPSILRRRLAIPVKQLNRPYGRWTYVFAQPLLTWLLYAAVLWIWHWPVLYEAALRSRWMHDLQHATFFFSALLYWRLLLDPFSRLRTNGGAAALSLFATSLHGGALGALMAFAPQPWYPAYEARFAQADVAVADQQLAGIIMWMPTAAAYAILAALVFGHWLWNGSAERKTARGAGRAI
jgi:putative membrane protein